MKLNSLTKMLASSLLLASFLSFMGNASAVKIPAGVKLASEQVYNLNATVPETIDPTFSADVSSITYIEKVFDTLVRLSPEGKYIPVAAVSYKTSADGKTWTFNLRKEAKWQDGKTVKAQDFVYSWRRLTDPKTGSPYAFYLAMANVKNAGAIVAGKAPVSSLGVEAKDDYTLVVHLDQPTPWLDQMVSNPVLVPLRKDIIEKFGNKWTEAGNYIGNGPYIFKDYAFNDYIHLEKDPNYWDAANIYIQTINYDFIQSEGNGYFGYLTGKYLVSNIPPSFKRKVLATRPEEIKEISKDAVSWLVFNTNRVKDVNVRKAMSLLIDRKALVSKILNFGKPTSSFVPADLTDGDKVTEDKYFDRDYKANVAEANQILEQAGYSKDNPATVTYITAPSDKKFMNAFANWINKGSQGKINLKFNMLEQRAYLEERRAKKADLAQGGWFPDYYHVSSFFNIFLCGNPVNEFDYCNKDYDKLVYQANVAKSAKERQELYGKALEVIRNDYVVIPVNITVTPVLVSPALGGFNAKSKRQYVRDYYIIDGKGIKGD